ncbi:MAG: dTMP kinase [Bacteroidota bacterium]
MSKDSLFIVIEGLDGSGKTTVARKLAAFLEWSFEQPVKLSCEPNDACCGGLYIRQVLTKKIKRFSHKTLALAFAANRLDHGDRVIGPWLEGGHSRILISDRYYLSSLVYQSTESLSMEEVMEINNQARHPDIIFFMNVSNKVCFQRMKIRNQPQELFEVNLSETRAKYRRAIAFLQKTIDTPIIEVDGNGSIDESLLQMTRAIHQLAGPWRKDQLLTLGIFNQRTTTAFQYNGSTDWTLAHFLNDFRQNTTQDSAQQLRTTFEQLSNEQKGALCIDYLQTFGYQFGSRQLLPNIDAFELRYHLPLGLEQRGSILFLEQAQQLEKIFQYIPQIPQLADFLLIFSPIVDDLEVGHFERELVNFQNQSQSLSPSIRFLSGKTIIDSILA